MRRLIGFLKPFKKQVILGPLFKLTEAVLELLIPYMMMRVIDTGVIGGNTPFIWRMGAELLAVSVLGFLAALLCQYYASLAAQGVGTDLRNAVFRHIDTLSFVELDQFGTPSLINRVTADINQLQWAVAMLIRLVVRAPFLCVGGFVMAAILDPGMSMIILGVIAVFALLLYLNMTRAVPLFRSVQQKLDNLARILRENLTGVRVIRAFTRTGGEKERFFAAADAHAAGAIRVNRVTALVNPVTTLVMDIGILLLVWFGGVRVNAGALTTGKVIALINYVVDILAAMIVVANLVSVFTKAAASAGRVNELFDASPSIADGPGAQPDFEAPAVEFANVSLRYGGAAADALTGVSFVLHKGETLGIIGGTGAGKSTVAQLLCRFYDVTGGSVRLFGHDVRDYTLEQARALLGVVPQKSQLFSGTVADNLRWGNPDASGETLEAALHTAQAGFALSLAGGLGAPVSQGGVNFSGGQKQRLCIARALVRKPAVLILDDSASALDYMTEAALRRALRGSGGMTVVQISQRAASIMHADRILVLDDGNQAGLGTHEELLQSCPLYREICQSQQLLEEGA